MRSGHIMNSFGIIEGRGVGSYHKTITILNDEIIPIKAEADFCIEHCPHPDCECRGSCKEFEAWKKKVGRSNYKTLRGHDK